MKKAVTVIGGATIVLGAAGFTSNVQADEVTTQETTVQEAQQATPVTQEQLASAKSDVDTATEAVTNAQAEVVKAQEVVTQKQAEVDSAQSDVAIAEENVAKATPEAIQQAEKAITATTDEIATNSQVISDAKETEATAKEAVAAQETAVNQAQDRVSKAQTAVDSAQESVDQAQAILDGTNAQAVYDKAESTQKQVDADREVVKKAQATLTAAQAADAKRAQAIDAAEKAQTTAQADLGTKVEALFQVNTKATETANTLLSKQEAFTKAENDYEAINTITLSDDYVKYMKIAYEAGSWDSSLGKWVHKYADEERREANKKLLALGDGLDAIHRYKSNPNDAKIAIDITNLTSEQKQELALFAADLSNQVRKQMGTDPVDVTNSSVDMGWTQAAYYSTKFKTMWEMDHDTSKIKAEYGLKWVDEDLAGNRTNVSTMDGAKKAIYYAYTQWLFANNESLHASSIVGVRNSEEGADNHIGIGIAVLSDGSTLVNYNNASSVGIPASNTSFSTTPIENTKTVEAITASYNQAKEELAQATSANAQAQDAKVKAQQAVQSAQDTLDAAKAALASAKAVAVQTSSAQEKLDQANTKLAESIKANDAAQAAVASLTADIKTKKANLEAAKAVLVEKQEVLDSATAAYNAEVAKLTNLKASFEAATQAVADLEAKAQNLIAQLTSEKQALSDLKNAPELLKQAQAKLATAQAALKASKEVLAEKETLLAELEATQAEKEALYNSLSAAYDKQVEAERQAELAKQKAAIEAQGKVAVAVVNEKGQVVGFVADEVASTSQAPTVAKSAVHQATAQVATTSSVAKAKPSKAQASTLPTTGDDYSRNALSIAVGSFLIALGLFGTRRKHH